MCVCVCAAGGAGVKYEGTELKAATLEKLLEFLMQSTGSLALDTFLISYRNFASPQDLLRRLVYMYCKGECRVQSG